MFATAAEARRNDIFLLDRLPREIRLELILPYLQYPFPGVYRWYLPNEAAALCLECLCAFRIFKKGAKLPPKTKEGICTVCGRKQTRYYTGQYDPVGRFQRKAPNIEPVISRALSNFRVLPLSQPDYYRWELTWPQTTGKSQSSGTGQQASTRSN